MYNIEDYEKIHKLWEQHNRGQYMSHYREYYNEQINTMTIDKETINLKEKLSKYIEEGWLGRIAGFFTSLDGQNILKTLAKKKKEEVIFPKQEDTFNAFKYCKWKDLRVVIIGYSPYTEDNLLLDETTKISEVKRIPYADGLAYSNGNFNDWLKTPNSLKLILKEVERDIYKGDIDPHNNAFKDFSLKRWAEQGVLLLNQGLTTKRDVYGSHVDLWEPFFTWIMQELRENHTAIVYIVMGNYPNVYKLIDEKTNYLIKTPAPDTIIEDNFTGCGAFSKCELILKDLNGYGIKW